ncbi:protein of unknown function [Streptomyces sp. WMMB 714]|uniref:DUF397 domain-containing protein n=1 Tax=Streptomyces sp. WMMB 714 TaxID=1286822 RepID=UPI0005F7BFDB|nr:DUF397 domain-containing protein [Streptomyces sp. WMMB 714]SCK17535.1 protein of unknown function [Streptomyces sp. WMMB 714]
MSAGTPDLTDAVWRKGSRSNPSGGDCVELALNVGGFVPVRDSKDPGGPLLVFPSSSWAAFVEGVKRDGQGAGGAAQA